MMFRFVLLACAFLYSVDAATKLGEYGCFYYTLIDDVTGIKVINCQSSEVFDPVTRQCIKPTANNWPCTDVKDCSTLANHRYVDSNVKDPAKMCKTYYTCQNGYYYGHNYCPEGTVYNEDMQYCDWPVNVKPPCGTKA